MLLRSLLKSLHPSFTLSPRRAEDTRRVRLCLETLEDRIQPNASTLVSTELSAFIDSWRVNPQTVLRFEMNYLQTALNTQSSLLNQLAPKMALETSFYNSTLANVLQVSLALAGSQGLLGSQGPIGPQGPIGSPITTV